MSDDSIPRPGYRLDTLELMALHMMTHRSGPSMTSAAT